MGQAEPPRRDDDGEFGFIVGPVRVVVMPARPGRLARFLLFSNEPVASSSRLLGSGSEHDTASCVGAALRAAHRADAS